MESTSEATQLLLDSSSPSFPRRKYDVFLSFRGEDTRRSFTDHLFNALCRVGVHTFIDAEEVHKGEEISIELISAIKESMISIIIFSKNYASSSWCLRELEEILKCRKRVNQTVLPVFYDVKPSELRKQTGGFVDALTLHRQRFGDEQVNQWKDDLKEVADFSGWDLQNDADGYESKLIEKIVETALQLVNRTYLNVAKHPVGIHTHVREILSLLQSEPNGGVRVIGIYGMGGVGKTTLAKAVFNEICGTFEGSCFLADVRSQCLDRNSAGLRHLQTQLLCKTLETTRFDVDHVDEGISLIKLRLGLKKLLIVVDDVDHESQLDALVGERDWFGSGSTIIITTRHVNLLNGPGKDYEKYKVEVLSSKESLQLFSLYAFNNPNPSEAFVELSNMIVSYVGGLPLALTVLGSHFRARSSVQEWRDDFEKLKKIPHDDILKKLEISYKALDDDTRRIFLDIACAYTYGQLNKEEILMILNSCGFHAQSGISVLKDKCLLTEGDVNFHMHGLVRDMGRAIAHKESLYPEKRSRLFLSDEDLDVLLNNKGTESIQTMTIDLQTDVPLSTKVFSKMTRLRVLKILSMNVSGSLKYLSDELRLLYWQNCSLRRMPTDYCPKKLVILKIIGSNIVEFQPKLQNFICLEVLSLEDCGELKRAPNFTGAHSLKKLTIFRCSNLVKISKSIGDLKNLVSLEVFFCKNLRALPSSICKLKSLEVLIMLLWSKKKELPEVSMWYSKDAIREYLCSHKVIGSSPHNTWPVYLEEKLKLFFLFSSLCGAVDYVLKYKSTGVELLSGSWPCDYKAAWECDYGGPIQFSFSEYGYFTEPIKVEELELSMVSCPLKPGLEEKVNILPCIFYVEKDGDGAYLFSMEPNVEIKVSPVRIRHNAPLPPSDALMPQTLGWLLSDLAKKLEKRKGISIWTG